MTIYIGNFDTKWNDEQLASLFTPYGEVTSAAVMMDLFTERSRGFGFVTMTNEAEAVAAIESLHQKEIENSILTVKMADPQTEKGGSYKVGTGGVNPFRFKKN